MDQSGSSGTGSSGFDMSKMSTASKLIGIGGVLYLVDLFLPWQRVCISFLSVSTCGSVSGFHGIGILNFLIVAVLIVMEVLLLANVSVDVGTPEMRMQVDSYLCFALLVLTVLKVLVDNTAIYLFAWVGLVLAIIVAYGGFVRFKESRVTPPAAPPAPPMPGGGMST